MSQSTSGPAAICGVAQASNTYQPRAGASVIALACPQIGLIFQTDLPSTRSRSLSVWRVTSSTRESRTPRRRMRSFADSQSERSAAQRCGQTADSVSLPVPFRLHTTLRAMRGARCRSCASRKPMVQRIKDSPMDRWIAGSDQRRIRRKEGDETVYRCAYGIARRNSLRLGVVEQMYKCQLRGTVGIVEDPMSPLPSNQGIRSRGSSRV